MATRDFATKEERDGIEIQLFSPNCAWMRSNWPVTSPRGNTSVGTELLSEALEEGVVAKCDTKRNGFFEVDIGRAWFYFHVAHNLAVYTSSPH